MHPGGVGWRQRRLVVVVVVVVNTSRLQELRVLVAVEPLEGGRWVVRADTT